MAAPRTMFCTRRMGNHTEAATLEITSIDESAEQNGPCINPFSRVNIIEPRLHVGAIDSAPLLQMYHYRKTYTPSTINFSINTTTTRCACCTSQWQSLCAVIKSTPHKSLLRTIKRPSRSTEDIFRSSADTRSAKVCFSNPRLGEERYLIKPTRTSESVSMRISISPKTLESGYVVSASIIPTFVCYHTLV